MAANLGFDPYELPGAIGGPGLAPEGLGMGPGPPAFPGQMPMAMMEPPPEPSPQMDPEDFAFQEDTAKRIGNAIVGSIGPVGLADVVRLIGSKTGEDMLSPNGPPLGPGMPPGPGPEMGMAENAPPPAGGGPQVTMGGPQGPGGPRPNMNQLPSPPPGPIPPQIRDIVDAVRAGKMPLDPNTIRLGISRLQGAAGGPGPGPGMTGP